MKPNLSPEELLALSAYIDDDLSAPERVALEQRLATDADLRRELENLRQTVALLQLLPALKAPRDFTLDPAAYGNQTPPKVIRPATWQRVGLAVAALLMLVCGVGVGLQLLTSDQDETTFSDVAINNTDTNADTMFAMTAVAQAMPTATAIPVTPPASLPDDIIAKGTATAVAQQLTTTEAEAVQSFAATPMVGSTAAAPATIGLPMPTASPLPTLQPTEELSLFDDIVEDEMASGDDVSPIASVTATVVPTQSVEAVIMPTALPHTQDADTEEQGILPVVPAMAETSPTLGIATGSSAAPAGDAEADRASEDETVDTATTNITEPTALDAAGGEGPSVNRNSDLPAAINVINHLVSALPALIWQLLLNLIEVLVGHVPH